MDTTTQTSAKPYWHNHAPTILRVAMALLFLWFGISQISDPTSWIGFVPQSIATLTHLSVNTLVMINGTAEIILGTMLLLGLCTRVVAFLLFLHLLDITFTVSLDAIGIRDLGLAIAVFIVFLNGWDYYTLDRYIRS